MRILRLIISSFLLFTVIIVAGFFISREVLLYWGTTNITNSLKTLNLARTKNSYASQCVSLGSNAVFGEDVVSYDLRFLSSSEYLLEAVCEGFLYDPITISQASLPQFVTKVPGTSGFFSSNYGQSGIELQVFAQETSRLTQAIGFDFSFLSKKTALVAENGILIQSSATPVIGNGPVTSCPGYGYECCNEVSHFGVGDRITGLVDCEQSCYSACASRPVLLSFNTFPILNPTTRVLEIASGSVVEFTYVADSGKATNLTGILDFGDGKKSPVTGLAGQSSHTYECNRASCEYVAQITFEDSWGVKSAELGISKVTIIVTR